MRIQPPRLVCLEEREIQAIVTFALRILEDVGMKIENRRMCEHLAAHGVTWDGEFRVHFPRRLIEGHLEAERRPKDQPPRPVYKAEGGISGYAAE